MAAKSDHDYYLRFQFCRSRQNLGETVIKHEIEPDLFQFVTTLGEFDGIDFESFVRRFVYHCVGQDIVIPLVTEPDDPADIENWNYLLPYDVSVLIIRSNQLIEERNKNEQR